VDEVLKAIGPIGSRWTRVLEPTCGTGNFLRGVLAEAEPPRELIGIELQKSHFEAARAISSGSTRTRVEILLASVFGVNLGSDLAWNDSGPLLVLGNPPWVTSSELGKLGSENHPTKRNLKSLRGLEARTGAANFDIAEALWLKLMAELASEQPTIAMLCKTSVARAVLEFAYRRRLPIAEAAIFEIDTVRWFGAAVGACLLRVTLGAETGRTSVPVFAQLDDRESNWEIGFFQDRLIADWGLMQKCEFALGTCPLVWRQGLKHDAASVMELWRKVSLTTLTNRLGEEVEIEPEFVFPLLKGADLQKSPHERASRWVIVTQRRIGEETESLEHRAPLLWRYLMRHSIRFTNRRSSIYRGQPRFALFGIGPYSFAPFKVAISGLHRTPLFRAVGPCSGLPVMCDDTCYHLPCRSASEAALLTALCNHRVSLRPPDLRTDQLS
jgi:hypothetical protein